MATESRCPSIPNRLAVPLAGRSMSISSRMVVVFPAPLGPRKLKIF
jgi:hypothetical protein